MLLLGLIGGSATAATAQVAGDPTQISQQGEKNVIKMEIKDTAHDTLKTRTRVITQRGTNQIRIDTNTSPDSLQKLTENVAIDQTGKSNVVSIKSETSAGNSVQIRQSGSNNSITIKQN